MLKRIRNFRIANTQGALILAALGAYFLYCDLSNSHMENMHHPQSANILGIGEMTWMWFSMAVIHFFMRKCECSSGGCDCKK